MAHLVLLGDSIFDNAAYVEGGPAVIDHVRLALDDSTQPDFGSARKSIW